MSAELKILTIDEAEEIAEKGFLAPCLANRVLPPVTTELARQLAAALRREAATAKEQPVDCTAHPGDQRYCDNQGIWWCAACRAPEREAEQPGEKPCGYVLRVIEENGRDYAVIPVKELSRLQKLEVSQPDEDSLERVAKALFNNNVHTVHEGLFTRRITWEELAEGGKDHLRNDARAAIAAMPKRESRPLTPQERGAAKAHLARGIMDAGQGQYTRALRYADSALEALATEFDLHWRRGSDADV